MSSQQVNRNTWIYARGAKPLHFNYKTCVHISSPVPRVPSARSEEPTPQGLGHGGAGTGGGGGDKVVLPGWHPRDWLLPWGLCRRDLAGGDGGGLCLASRCVLVTQWVLATAEGCDHAVAELGEREAQGETDTMQLELQSPAELPGTPSTVVQEELCLHGVSCPTVCCPPIYCQPCLLQSWFLHQPSTCIISGGMALHL